MEEWITKS